MAAIFTFLFHRYPRFPALRHHRKVGRCVTRLDGCPQMAIYYPLATDATASDRRDPYFRQEVVAAASRHSKLPTWFFSFLRNKAPYVSNGPICKKQPEEEGLPVILFSHGLFGTLEMYSTLCSQLAASGYVVMALEHEDGSALYAEDMQGVEVPPRSSQSSAAELQWFGRLSFRNALRCVERGQ